MYQFWTLQSTSAFFVDGEANKIFHGPLLYELSLSTGEINEIASSGNWTYDGESIIFVEFQNLIHFQFKAERYQLLNRTEIGSPSPTLLGIVDNHLMLINTEDHIYFDLQSVNLETREYTILHSVSSRSLALTPNYIIYIYSAPLFGNVYRIDFDGNVEVLIEIDD